MITIETVRERFGDIWPHHNRAFNELLVVCRRAFGGDLDRMIILSIIGERSLPNERALGISYDQFLEGRRGPLAPRPINTRETVRRKVAQLIECGWVGRDEAGLLFVLPQASQDLRPITEGTLEYLRSVGEILLKVAFTPPQSTVSASEQARRPAER